MKNTIQFITIAILISISFLAANAQDSTIVTNTEDSTAKVEKKETPKKQSSSDDVSWTGFYVGGYAGNNNGRASANTSTVYSTSGYFSPTTVGNINRVGTQIIKSNNFTGGGTIGYNFQKRNFLIGAEFDFGANRISQSVSGSGTYTSTTAGFTITQSVKSNWMMTLRPRVGAATKKVLLYATGGLAVTNLKYAGNFTETSLSGTESGSFSKTKKGWAAGGGIEFKVSSRWSVKTEYLFSQFGRDSITANNFTVFPGNTPLPRSDVFTHSTDLKSHNIRFGVNYRF